jgi:Holliday junction resolvasome RuvABC endonuclease subunit
MGIDPSLTSCGVIVIDHEKKVLLGETLGYTIKHPSEKDRIKRSLEICQRIVHIGRDMDCRLIAIEGLGMMAKMGRMGNQIFLAELLGVLKAQVFISLRVIPDIVPPPSWKKRVIGSGKADKVMIKQFLETKGYNFDKQDIYDALGVALYLHETYMQALINKGETDGKRAECSSSNG